MKSGSTIFWKKVPIITTVIIMTIERFKVNKYNIQSNIFYVDATNLPRIWNILCQYFILFLCFFKFFPQFTEMFTLLFRIIAGKCK